ncbi:MAG TPA: phosphotransferase [Actinomycetota bacterium]|nr:phosphotransferase [Actinomycetota bacterium]
MLEPTETWLREVVAGATGRPAPAAVRRLPGHASRRSYWRVGDPGRDSYIVMLLAPDAAPDEIGRVGPLLGVVPFVEVQRYLARLGVRVPRVLSWSQGQGYAVLEDLGDETLNARVLGGAAPAPLYRAAIDQLVSMQVRAERAPDPGCVAFQRAFDADIYRWELDHFLEWGLGAWKGVALPGPEYEVVTAAFDAIARRIVAEATVFTHRDYQSRNLMLLPGGEQAVIDFQDALLGPRAYDLVALLRDSYIALEPELIVQLIRHYLATTAAAGGPQLNEAGFRESFDLLTVQRKLKDAGRFVFIERVKGNPSFLRFVPAALGYVRDALARLPDLADLQAILARYIPELEPEMHP